MELNCQTCGQKAEVQGFIAAAQQPCKHCGQLLMGPVGRGPRTAMPPPGFGDPLPTFGPLQARPRSSAGLWVGMVVGVLVGVGVVVAVAKMGSAIPGPQRGALLGALSGVLLVPIFAVSGFLSMLILPFSLEGILGDSLWNRMAKAINERRLGPLFLPVLIYVGLPMALCAYGGSRMKDNAPLVITAGLGAVILGAVLGAMFGSLAGKSRQVQ